MTSEWLKLDEACLAAGVSRATMYRWINSGLPTREHPDGLQINADVLDRWRSIQAARHAGLRLAPDLTT